MSSFAKTLKMIKVNVRVMRKQINFLLNISLKLGISKTQ